MRTDNWQQFCSGYAAAKTGADYELGGESSQPAHNKPTYSIAVKPYHTRSRGQGKDYRFNDDDPTTCYLGKNSEYSGPEFLNF
jgi:hypothetical protein